VGFRPFVHTAAGRFGLKGWVLNDTKGVLVEVEGERPALRGFIEALESEAPPLACIESVETAFRPPAGYTTFEIRRSEQVSERFVLISPDMATCEDCRREVMDPGDRRYAYPFTNCTNCGPRFTIIEDIPYDRPKTTMKTFLMCPDCRAEYEDPRDRRFHAQPNACPRCGPSLRLVAAGGGRVEKGRIEGGTTGREALWTALRLLREGKILAVKGLGGYHLACDAENREAVGALRRRKYREDKPFAVMCPRVEQVEALCRVSAAEKELLLSPKRPILLLEKRPGSPVAEEIAPRNPYLGVMLPYTPLHHLLFHPIAGEEDEPEGPGGKTAAGDPLFRALVMTSGNSSDEPIAYEDADAFRRLRGIADAFLIHDRPIHMRCDDSVIRVFRDREMVLRRSRGYVPYPVKLGREIEEVLACGGELKNTFCLTRGEYAFLSHHIGDLENLETLESFERGIEHFKRLFSLAPRILAYDLHPNYLSTQYARDRARSDPGLRLVGVQHHHAHVASCMAEWDLAGEVIGVAFDGTGYGTDGTIWGAEFLVADRAQFRRAAHLRPLPLPGGERAIVEPWRSALSALRLTFGDDLEGLRIDWLDRTDREERALLLRLLDRNVNCPLSSGMGRLFDVVASLLGVRDRIHYEGQAAIELELLAATAGAGQEYAYGMEEKEGRTILDPIPLVREVVADLRKGAERAVIARRFHSTVARMVQEACFRIRADTGMERVVLTGGVFQNMILLEALCDSLEALGFQVYTHSRVPANDGGIALGQAVIASERVRRDSA
jgi:hydrogenase maturation protein HypF